MIEFLERLFRRRAAALSEARPRDAAAMSELHGESFHRGWSEEEVAQLLLDRHVIAHRAMLAGRLTGFILSRQAAGEAEILSVAVTVGRRRSGIGQRLLDTHLRQLAALGTRTVFLEVDENNAAALALYRRFGFREAARREAYYPGASGARSAALVMRCDVP